MSTVKSSIDLDVPAATAYAAWSDFASFPTFMDDIESVDVVDDDNTRWHAKVGGQDVVFTATITKRTPNDRISWTSTGGDVDHEGTVVFSDRGSESSHLEVTIGWEPEGLGEWLGAVLSIPTVAVHRQLEKFKRHVEGPGA